VLSEGTAPTDDEFEYEPSDDEPCRPIEMEACTGSSRGPPPPCGPHGGQSVEAFRAEAAALARSSSSRVAPMQQPTEVLGSGGFATTCVGGTVGGSGALAEVRTPQPLGAGVAKIRRVHDQGGGGGGGAGGPAAVVAGEEPRQTGGEGHRIGGVPISSFRDDIVVKGTRLDAATPPSEMELRLQQTERRHRAFLAAELRQKEAQNQQSASAVASAAPLA